ncbi:E3 ubiquitin-protein ligase RNFT1 [Bombina bombina]|uniref:E3 ubiquitin-protein ligase RNFT1 n=1 Tax=Bombina bombina TaxID=8345 RepID=UPI00235ABED7|nr:E3 ubiquitin-protein ligase RNFT1 [Bombina bombina]
MKYRSHYERRRIDVNDLEDKKAPTMQSSSGFVLHQSGNCDSSTDSTSLPATRLPTDGSSSTGDVNIEIHPSNSDGGARSGSRHTRSNIHGRSQNRHGHTHSHTHDSSGSEDSNNADSREQSSSVSEFRHIIHWLQKSLPYILILCAKLIVQHTKGISVGIGLLTTFLYANKCIVNQVFLRDKYSKLQCIWLLVFLTSSSILLYYTFYPQALYYSLIFLNPTIGPLQFWDVLWVVGITSFVVKFIFMSLKCLVLLVPSFVMSYKCKGYWHMCLEECAQYYCSLVPVPVWFRYLSDYGDQDRGTGWHFGVLLALLYIVLKLFVSFGQWKTLPKMLQLFCTQPTYGVAATKRQCSEVNDICSICQTEFTKPIVLLCQHIFCEECISLWFNREKTCPLCRTVISDHIYKWNDGATSLQLQLF